MIADYGDIYLVEYKGGYLRTSSKVDCDNQLYMCIGSYVIVCFEMFPTQIKKCAKKWCGKNDIPTQIKKCVKKVVWLKECFPRKLKKH